jgi:drug/metabolite transporter (DMT)-like permease
VTRRAWLVFALVSALWGAPYLLIKIAVHDLSPPVIVCARTMIGAAALLPLAARRGQLRVVTRRWPWLLVLGAIEMAAPFTLITAGERHIASSLAGILVASAPLFVALIAVRVAPHERPHAAAVIGLITGFAGVIVLLGLDVSGSGAALAGSGEVLLAAALYAVAAHVLNARFAGVSPVAVMGCVMAVAALLLTVPAALSLPTRAPGVGAVAAVIGLGVLCTAVAFAGFAALLAEVGPSRASVVAYVAPAFAVILGVAFRSEPVSWSTLLGLVLILGGSWTAASPRPHGEPVVPEAVRPG